MSLQTIFVDDLDARVVQIAERGIEPVVRPRGQSAVMLDPEGNEFCLLAPPLSWDDRQPALVSGLAAREDRLVEGDALQAGADRFWGFADLYDGVRPVHPWHWPSHWTVVPVVVMHGRWR